MDRALILRLLCEGKSIATVCRASRTHRTAVRSLQADGGRAAAWYQDRVLRELAVGRILIDVTPAFRVLTGPVGVPVADDVWNWLALDIETKLIVSWLVGEHDGATAGGFLADVAARIDGPVALAIEDDTAYLDAADDGDRFRPDDTRLAARYGGAPPAAADAAAPPGDPGDHLRWRGFAALTKSAARRIVGHAHGLALSVLHHNFVRVRDGSGTTPATAAGITKAPWADDNLADVVRLWQDLKTGPWHQRVVVLSKGTPSPE
jgi:hypothetical protein